MSALQISGLACPFNVYNDFNELIKPGAFTEFIDQFNHAIHPVPMCIMHGDRCGEWTELRQTDKGLEVTGFVESESGKLLVRERILPQLSISFVTEDTGGLQPETFKRNRERPRGARGGLSIFKLDEWQTYDCLGLSEISLVDDGSFPGTNYMILKDDVSAAEDAKAVFATVSR